MMMTNTKIKKLIYIQMWRDDGTRQFKTPLGIPLKVRISAARWIPIVHQRA
jgi:hypothetical protein